MNQVDRTIKAPVKKPVFAQFPRFSLSEEQRGLEQTIRAQGRIVSGQQPVIDELAGREITVSQ